MYLRDNELKAIIVPRPKIYKGPVAILIDGLSASMSEIFAGGLKDLDRARVFGTTTAGAALPSQMEKLPNGDGFQFAMANYISTGGDVLEGTGVIPDEEIRPTRDQLLAGSDPVLEAAVTWILSLQ
jgi:carboxyl-terminal processing protease